MEQRHKTIIAIGSNYGQQQNLSTACERLGEVLCGMVKSRSLWTEPIGIISDRFLNIMVSGWTAMSLDELVGTAKLIERDCGRTDEEQRKGLIRIDIDIMEFDGIRLHLQDWSRGYINTLLKEIR